MLTQAQSELLEDPMINGTNGIVFVDQDLWDPCSRIEWDLRDTGSRLKYDFRRKLESTVRRYHQSIGVRRCHVPKPEISIDPLSGYFGVLESHWRQIANQVLAFLSDPSNRAPASAPSAPWDEALVDVNRLPPEIRANPLAAWPSTGGTGWWNVISGWEKQVLAETRMSELKTKLLGIGGHRLGICPGTIYRVDEILDRGRVFTPRAVVKQIGTPHRCHWNSAEIWAMNRDRYRIASGYALDLGTWYSHTWVVDGDTIIETTADWERYVGYVLTKSECAEWYDDHAA